MYHTQTPSTSTLNLEAFRDKVLGCWTGKNIGGTLGAPFEGKKEMNDVTFYTEDLSGNPIPNDDLDLQLIWLLAAEEKGLYNLNERVLGEYWLTHITGPWNEYGVCKSNMKNGLLPPLSGACNNDHWKYSNGAWIRSEIWACLFPGSVDEACQYAYYDACVDHAGEGIYAEVFTAALESAAFIESDVRQLINIGLSRIPEDCRIARAVRLACDSYDAGKDLKTTREALVKDSDDLGWFQAPANIGYVVVGLLYGAGDFGKSVCYANNCGDDTDCTAGTVGAILGIIYGRKGLPQKWIDPIGENIITCSIDTYGRNNLFELPKTLGELTDAVVRLACSSATENPTLVQLSDGDTVIADDLKDTLLDATPTEKRVLARDPYDLAFDLPFGTFHVHYEDGPEVTPGQPKGLRFSMSHMRHIDVVVTAKVMLPEEWTAAPGATVFTAKNGWSNRSNRIELIPGPMDCAYHYLPLEIRLSDRFSPTLVTIPLQLTGAVNHDVEGTTKDPHQEHYHDAKNRIASRQRYR